MTSERALKRWVLEAVKFYRPRGFFQTIQGSDLEVAEKLLPYLKAQNQAEQFDAEDLSSPEFDLFLLSCDPHRALYDGIEFGDALTEGSGAYVATLKSLAKISRGAFRPTDIEEFWAGPEGPIHLDFRLGQVEHSLVVNVWGGIFDFRLLLQLNQLLGESEYRFEMVPLDDILFVTVLKAEEKTDMERDRDLSFMVLDLPRTFSPLHRFTGPMDLPEASSQEMRFLGTLNEHLDRCIGRLRFVLKGVQAEGRHTYLGMAHQENFALHGFLDRATGKLKGNILGTITVGGEARNYEGRWQAQLSPGNRILTGTWVGWFRSDRTDDEERPSDPKLLYRGELGLIEETLLRSGDLYIRRLKSWLELVWESKDNQDYPWLLPLE